MSVKDRMILPFVTLKSVPDSFDFHVNSYVLDKVTKFGNSDFLNGQFIQNTGPKKTDKLPKGTHLLRLSATAYSELEKLGVEHLDELKDKIITFEKQTMTNRSTKLLVPIEVRLWTDAKPTKD